MSSGTALRLLARLATPCDEAEAVSSATRVLRSDIVRKIRNQNTSMLVNLTRDARHPYTLTFSRWACEPGAAKYAVPTGPKAITTTRDLSLPEATAQWAVRCTSRSLVQNQDPTRNDVKVLPYTAIEPGRAPASLLSG